MGNPVGLDLIGWFISVCYLIGGWGIYILVLKNYKQLTVLSVFGSLLIFLFPYGIIILEQLMPIRTIPPDAYIYSGIIRDFSAKFNQYSFGVAGFALLNWPLIFLAFGKPFIYLVFNILMYNLGVFFLFRAFRIYGEGKGIYFGKNVFFLVQLLSICYPVGIFNTVSLLREAALIFFFGISCFLLASFEHGNLNKKNRGAVGLVIFSIGALFLIRPITGFSMILILMILVLRKNISWNVINLFKAIFGVLILFYLSKMVISSVINLNFDMQWIASYRATSAAKYGPEGYGVMEWEGFTQYVKNMALLFLQYLFSPLPLLVSWEVSREKFIPLLDTVFVFFLVSMCLLFYNRKYAFWLFQCALILMVPALFETNISGAYRHRLNGVLMLVPVVALIISKFRITLKRGQTL